MKNRLAWALRAIRRERARFWIRTALFVATLGLVIPMIVPDPAVGQAHVDKGVAVGIQNQTERELFYSLICMCGCPRETLGTCTCGYGHERRSELREMLTSGMSVQAIQKSYAARFGSQSLAVPSNEGLGLLIWAFPLIAFIAGAVVVVRLLRRWTRPAPAAAGGAPIKDEGPKETSRDELDDRIDDELKELDR